MKAADIRGGIGCGIIGAFVLFLGGGWVIGQATLLLRAIFG